jgi:transcriptional antiterminator NusG
VITMVEKAYQWYALYVRSRHEFVVRDELQRRGVETFLPSSTKLRWWKDRRKQVEFPLFPGYLFVHIHPDPESYVGVLRTRGAVRFISLEPGPPACVPEDEIRSLWLMMTSGEELDVYPHLKEGERVRIRRGPLATATGQLVRKEGSNLFLVNVEILGRSVGVKIYDDDIEPA